MKNFLQLIFISCFVLILQVNAKAESRNITINVNSKICNVGQPLLKGSDREIVVSIPLVKSLVLSTDCNNPTVLTDASPEPGATSNAGVYAPAYFSITVPAGSHLMPPVVTGGVDHVAQVVTGCPGTPTTSFCAGGTYKIRVSSPSSNQGTFDVTATLYSTVIDIAVTENSGIAPDDAIICPLDPVTLTASITSGGTASTYAWSSGGGGATINVNPSMTTTYTVTITDTNGCTDSHMTTVTVTSLPAPTINFTETSGTTNNDGTICEGDMVTLTASSTPMADTYAWSTGDATDAITVNPLVNTTYTVTITDVNGCTGTTQRNVVVNILPTALITITENHGLVPNDGIICLNNMVTLTASGGNSYSWSNGQMTAVINPMPPLGTTTFTVTVTSSLGCTATEEVIITVNDLPTVSNTTLRECEDPAGSGTATFTFADAEEAPAWIGGNSNAGNEIDNGITGLTVTYHNTLAGAQTNTNPAANAVRGNGTIYARVYDPTTGCFDVSTITLMVDLLPAFSNTTLRACADPNDPSSAEFNLNDATLAPGWPTGNSNTGSDIDNGMGGVTVTFHGSLGDAQTNTASTIADQGPYGATTVFARIESNTTGCFSVAQIALQIDPLPMAFDTELKECEDPAGSNSAMFTLTDANMTPGFNSMPKTNSNTTADVDGGLGTVTVTYHNSQGDAENNTGVAGNGTYANGTIVWARVEDNTTKCAGVSMVTLVVNPAPDGVEIQNADDGNSPNDFELCAGDDINLNVDVPMGTPPYTYTWTLPTGTATGNPLAISPAVVANHHGIWVVTVTDANGCTATDNIGISVRPNPTADQCGNAFNAGSGTDPIEVTGSNLCGTMDETAGCGDADESSVWITYTVPTKGLKALQLSLGGLAGGVVRAYEGCGGGLAGDSGCGSVVQIDCPPPGTVYKILVSSSRANEGNFSLNIRPTVNMLDITGKVYVDVNGDGMPQANENGYKEITLELVEGCPANGPVFGTTMTDADGNYMFQGVPPGSYTVRITTPPDSEPSGPKDCCLTIDPCLEEMLVCNLGFTLENCDENAKAGALCETAPLLCNVKQIEEFCSGLPIMEGVLSGQSLCPSGGVFNNTSWFQFVAGTGNYTFTVNPFNCVPGGGGSLGVQAGIFRSCDDLSDPVICFSNCSTNPVSVPTTALIPGNIYYFFLDGCAGSICSYTVQVTGNYSPFSIPQLDSISLESDCSPLCALSNIYTFKVHGRDPISNATLEDLTTLDYNWTITGPSGVQPDFTNINEIEVFFVEAGTYKICLESVTNYCDTKGPICKDVVVVDRLPDDYLGEFVICTGNFPWDGLTPDAKGKVPEDRYGNTWLGPEIQLADIQAGQFDFSYENTTDCGCKYTQSMRVISASSSTGVTDIAICPAQLPFTFDTLEITTNLDSFLYKFKTLKSKNGCDSLIKINARILNFAGNIRRGTCTPAGISMYFEIAPLYINGERDSIKYVWKDPSGAVIADNDTDDSTILVPVDGKYSVEVTIFKYGKGCTSTYTFNLNTSDLKPLNPIPDAWPLHICENDPEATYMVSSPEPNTKYIWTVPPTATVIQDDSSSVLIVRWNAAPGGNICVKARNQCGTSPDECLPVVYIDQTDPVFTMGTEICKDAVTTITATSTHIPGTVYNWSFDGGTAVNGDGTGPGPHQISWNVEGIKTVTLQVNEDGCISQVYSAMIDVVLPGPKPQFDCTSSISGVEFTWPDVGNATGYSVTVITGQPGVQGTNVYNVNGLSINETVSAQLTVSTNHPCGDVVSDIATCTTQDCPPITVSITAVPPICLTATSPTITLTATTTPNSAGTFTFGGPGVTGNVFDPKLANVGNNVITCVFKSDIGNCTYNAPSRTIIVNPTPLSTFTIDKQTACVLDEVTVTYTGGTVGGVYTWNFGTDVIGTFNGPGPHKVKWSTAGTKTITLTVAKDGCTSTQSTQSVTLAPVLVKPVISCVPQTTVDAVEFSWLAVANASGYEVFIDGVSKGVQTTLNYKITGLAEGTKVTIRVVAVSNNGCPSTEGTQTCTASNCPPNTKITFPQPLITLCLEPNTAKIPLTYTVTGTSGIGVPTITWSGNGVDNTAKTFDPVVAGVGNHFVKLLFVENTCETVDSFLVTIKAKPVAKFTSLDSLCVSDKLTLTYDGTKDATLKYTWDAVGATITPLTNSRFEFKWAAPGTYTIKLKVDVKGCESEEISKKIIVEGIPVPPVISCKQSLDNVVFTWNPIACATQYRVFINNAVKGTQKELTYTAAGLLEGEKVEIRIEPISTCKCPVAPVSLTCEAKACPPVKISLKADRNQICFNGASTPKIPINLTVTGNTADGKGSWTGVGLNNTVFDPVISGLGTFTLVYRYTDSGCDYADSTTIKVDPNPAVIWEIQNPACFNQTTGSFNYELRDGTGPFTTTLDGKVVTDFKITDINSGAHKFIAVDANGCKAEVDFAISTVSQPSFKISGPTIVSLGKESTHTINQADFAGLKIDSIVWIHNGKRVCAGIQNCFEYKVTANKGENNLEVIVYYNSACEIRATYKFVVTDQFITEFPNIINPNSNSGNDKFAIFTTDENLFVRSMRIYDRWGNKVFEALNFSAFTDPAGWDGTFGGRELVPGVFTYIFEMENAKNKNIIEKGDVTVLR